MKKFVIEREVPGAGSMTPEQLREAAAGSNEVIRELGPGVAWLQSFVTDDKIYCVFVASDEDVILEHARCTEQPADRISQVRYVADPSSAEGATAPSAVSR